MEHLARGQQHMLKKSPSLYKAIQTDTHSWARARKRKVMYYIIMCASAAPPREGPSLYCTAGSVGWIHALFSPSVRSTHFQSTVDASSLIFFLPCSFWLGPVLPLPHDEHGNSHINDNILNKRMSLLIPLFRRS